MVLIVVNGSSSDERRRRREPRGRRPRSTQLLSGIPQSGWSSATRKRQVELIEFGDLQCPVCKAYSEEFLPPVIENQVKNGEAKIVFRNFTIIGAQSAPAGAAAIAAGDQGRGWNYLELFYRNQGEENSGYADDEFLTAVAKGAGVKDIAKWNKDRKSAKVTDEVENTTARSRRRSASPARRRSRSKARAPTASNSSARRLAEEFEEAIEEAG